MRNFPDGGCPHMLLALLGLLLHPLFASAETQMVFPRVLLQAGRFSGIAIANPSSDPAELTLQAYLPDGTPFLSPVTILVPAGSQTAKLAWELLGAPDSVVQGASPTRLWLEAKSSVDGLTGFYLEGTDALERMDGSALSGKGTDLIVPLIEHTNGSTTEISLVNPGDSGSVRVQFEFLRDDGSVVLSVSEVAVPPRGAMQGSLSEFFGQGLSDAGVLRIRADHPVVCYVSILRLPDDSLVSVPAQNAALPARTLYFPQLAQGDAWATTVGLTNSSSSSVVVRLTAYRGDGTLFTAPAVRENPVSVILPARGSRRVPAGDLFGFDPSALQSGWVKAEAGVAAIHGYVEYGAGTNRALVVAQPEGYQRSVFSHQALQPPYFTGLAVLNPGSLAVNLEVVSLNATSLVLGKSQYVLKPGQRESLLVQQWVPAATGTSGGAVFVKSDAPVLATQLFGTDSLAALANVPPQLVTADFDPGAAIPSIQVTPPLAVVETGKTLQFISSGAGAKQWAVNGIAGGSASLGTISSGGLYAAPGLAPEEKTLTLQASSDTGSQSGGATVDVVQRETLTSGLTLVTAVAYLENLQRFFIAEQQALTSAPRADEKRRAAGAARLYEQPPTGSRTLLLEIESETFGKLLPFTDAGQNPYLLIAGTDGGKIYRLNVADKGLAVVAEGLDKPNSLAFDSLSGDLLVSQENGVSLIPRSKFDPASSSAPGSPAREAAYTPPVLRVPISRPQGVASSECNGSVYVATADGDLLEFQGSRRRTLLSGLQSPRQVLILYRRASSCEEALTLLLTETTRITLYFPFADKRLPLISGLDQAYDLAFFPRQKPFAGVNEASIVVAERGAGPGQGRVIRIRVGSIYDNVPPGATTAAAAAALLRDPAGDTFETPLTPKYSQAVPDLIAVNSHVHAGRVVLALTFNRPVAKPGSSLPNSLAGYIDLDFAQDGEPSHVLPYNVFSSQINFGVDAYIDLARETLYWGPYFYQSAPVEVRYLGEIVVILFDTNLARPADIRFAVLVGNRREMTDVFPNFGAARLVP